MSFKNLKPRSVLLIPMQEPKQTIFVVPEPNLKEFADLLLLEIPDFFTVSHSDFTDLQLYEDILH